MKNKILLLVIVFIFHIIAILIGALQSSRTTARDIDRQTRYDKVVLVVVVTRRTVLNICVCIY